MSLMTFIVLIVCIVIALKSGILKSFGFLAKFIFFPGLFTVVGLVAGNMFFDKFLATLAMGLVGLIVGIIMVIKDGKDKVSGEK